MFPVYTEIPQKTSRALLTNIQSEGREKWSIVFYWRVLMQEMTGYGRGWALRSFHRESIILFHASPFFLFDLQKWWFMYNWRNVILILWQESLKISKSLNVFIRTQFFLFLNSLVWGRDESFGFSFMSILEENSARLP